MSAEDEFAERVRKRHTCMSAEHVRTWHGGSAVQRIRARRIWGWSAAGFAERFLNGCSMRFALHAMERGLPSGTGVFSGTPLVLYKQQSRPSADNTIYKLLLHLNQIWQKGNALREKSTVYQDALAQNIVKRMERIMKPGEVWHGQLTMQKELTVFRDIATIFVNRGSRPDLAKKAERDLVKTLSREYREQNPAKESQENHVYQRQITQEALVTTKRTVTELEEQIKKQKTLLLQLQKSMETEIHRPEPDVGKLAGEVMRRMEREMHLERLRRGL